MSASLRRALLCLLVAALAFLAHAPLFGSGFVGGDLDLLAEAAGRYDGVAERSAWLASGEIRPIPAMLLRAHASLHEGLSPVEPGVAAPYFVFALVVLLVAAAGAGVTLRRLLVPWLGESAARAAGWACAGMVVAHPVGVAAVARPSALGDLVGLALVAWCTAFFLRGRQQRRDRFLVVAAALAVAAGFASSVAWLVPFACGALEYLSAHRPRATSKKLAAASTVVFAGVVAIAIEAAFAWPRDFGFRAGTPWSAYEALRAGANPDRAFLPSSGFEALDVLNALGLLFVPVPSPAAAGAYMGCVVLLLLAAEPLLRAVRAAPRLWGWLVLGWIVAMAVALPLALARAFEPPIGRAETAQALLPGAIVACAALATAATALGGSRRTVMPIAIAALLCLLSDRTARIWPESSRDLLALRGDLERGLAAAENGPVYVVGLRNVLRRELPRTGFGLPDDLDLVAGPWPPRFPLESRLRGADANVIPYVLRLPSLEDARQSGLAVLLLDRDERPVFRIPARSGQAKPPPWNSADHYGKSPPELTFDPFALTMVRVTPRAGVSTATAPRMRWRSRNPIFEQGAIDGAWVATDAGPQAIFDLGRSMDWLLGEKVLRIWFEAELTQFTTAEVLPRIDIPGVTRESIPDVEELERALPRPWTGAYEWIVLEPGPSGYLATFEGTSWPQYCGQDTSRLARIFEARLGDVTVARSAAFEPRAR